MNKRRKIILIVSALIVIAVAGYLISPLFISKESHDTSPLTLTDTQASVEREGSFVDGAHEVSGKALVIENGNNKLLRFENFETLNGPDLRIYLATDNMASDFVDLGVLKATKGEVNYEIPAGTDTEKYSTVLVWCRAFSVNFGSAQLVKE